MIGQRVQALRARVAVQAVRHPRVTIEVGPSVPAGALRILVAVAAVGCVALVATSTAHWVVAAAVIGAAVVRPAGPAPAILPVGVALLVLTSPSGVSAVRVAALVLGLHLVVELAALVGDVPWSAAVERRVLSRARPRFVAVQAATQVLVVVGVAVTDRPPATTWLPLVAGVALAASAWAVHGRLTRDHR